MAKTKRKKEPAGLTQEQKRVLEHARSALRDLDHDWPVKELAQSPETICEGLTEILGDSYDYEKGE